MVSTVPWKLLDSRIHNTGTIDPGNLYLDGNFAWKRSFIQQTRLEHHQSDSNQTLHISILVQNVVLIYSVLDPTLTHHKHTPKM
jgi:hypothetical protein